MRSRTISAISSAGTSGGTAARSSAVISARLRRTAGVSTQSGQTQLTRTPSWFASAAVNRTTAAFAAA